MKKIKNTQQPNVFSASLKKKADELGASYVAAKQEASLATDKVEIASAEVKSFAKTSGAVDNGRKVVQGDKFVVGYSIGTENYAVDLVLAKAILPTSVLKKILVEVINEKAFSALVESEEIDAATAKRLLKKTGLSSDRLYVREL